MSSFHIPPKVNELHYYETELHLRVPIFSTSLPITMLVGFGVILKIFHPLTVLNLSLHVQGIGELNIEISIRED